MVSKTESEKQKITEETGRNKNICLQYCTIWVNNQTNGHTHTQAHTKGRRTNTDCGADGVGSQKTANTFSSEDACDEKMQEMPQLHNSSENCARCDMQIYRTQCHYYTHTHTKRKVTMAQMQQQTKKKKQQRISKHQERRHWLICKTAETDKWLLKTDNRPRRHYTALTYTQTHRHACTQAQ